MPPLEFYTWDTPNGKKISILLEELGIEYTFKPMCERSARVSNVRPNLLKRLEVQLPFNQTFNLF